MRTYHVSWEIEVEANSYKEAAANALAIQRDNDPANSATVFTVKEQLWGNIYKPEKDIDLST